MPWWPARITFLRRRGSAPPWKRTWQLALAFDTHKAVTVLKQAGFAEPQAEAVVTTMGEALSGNVAMKTDLTEAAATLWTEMAEQFTTLYKPLWLMAVGIAGVTVTLVKLIP